MKIKNILSLLFCILLVISSLNTGYAQEFHGAVSAPVYNGGLKVLKEFITENNHYYEASNKDGITGVVTLSYTVNEKGKVKDIKILRGLNAICDSEAVRITQLITGWQAAVQWGKPISTRVVMPIEFPVKNDEQKGQSVTIKGNVSNKVTGSPIEGSLILAKGTSFGAITDKNGNYSIEVPGDGYELEYSSLGYERRSEKIGKNRTINVELPPEDLVIDFSQTD
jgi:TonB family protein